MENFIFCAVRRLEVERRLAKAKQLTAMLVCLYEKNTILCFSVKIYKGALNQLLLKKYICTAFAI